MGTPRRRAKAPPRGVIDQDCSGPIAVLLFCRRENCRFVSTDVPTQTYVISGLAVFRVVEFGGRRVVLQHHSTLKGAE
jgi:hypothetical protein